MIHELEPSAFSSVEPIFAGPERYVPALSVLRERFPGRVFADDPRAPSCAIVWALTRWAYIDGEANAAFLAELTGFLETIVFPLSLDLGRPWFELYANPSSVWRCALDETLSCFEPETHEESTYTFDSDAYTRLRRESAAPDGMALFAAEYPIVPEDLRAHDSMRQDCAALSTFGFELRDGHRVISVCRANGFAAGREFMVDVETPDPSARGQGYSTLTATALMDHAIAEGLDPLWETTEFNAPSQRLARKLGFTPGDPYPVYCMDARRARRPRQD